MATFVYASSQGQRTHSARTNFKSLPTQEVFNLLGVSVASSMESKRTFLTPERSFDLLYNYPKITLRLLE
jgi:hypothetical protein